MKSGHAAVDSAVQLREESPSVQRLGVRPAATGHSINPEQIVLTVPSLRPSPSVRAPTVQIGQIAQPKGAGPRVDLVLQATGHFVPAANFAPVRLRVLHLATG